MTAEDYLQGLPEDRRGVLYEVRATIVANLPPGYVEVADPRMIRYEVPLVACRDTYNKQPLMYAALASQKNHLALYLLNLYTMPGMHEAFVAEYAAATGKRPDLGKSCLRFKRLDQLPLDVIGRTIAAVPMRAFVAATKAARKESA